MQLSGKTAVITGAAGGIGSALVRALATAGANICAADNRSTEAVVEAGRAAGARVSGFHLDVTDPKQLVAMANHADTEFGGIDFLVTSAGVTGVGSAAALTEEEWDRLLSINLKGVFFSCQAVIGSMRRRGGGRIVNIGSILGKNGGNARPWIAPEEQERSSNIAYGISKAGVHTMTMYLARELAPSRITVNAVAPGPVASEMTKRLPESLKQAIPLMRLGTADEVAAAVLFLLGPSAEYITGEILDINGGMWVD